MKQTSIKYITLLKAIKIAIGNSLKGQKFALMITGLCLALISCKKKDEIPPATYQDGAYFILANKDNANAKDVADRLRLAFIKDFSFYFEANATTVQDTVWLPQVRIVGLAADHERTLNIVAVDTGTTAVLNKDYKLLNYTMPAGSYVSGKLGVVVYRTSALDNSTVKLMLRLQPNADFPAPMAGNSYGYDANYLTGDTYTITLTNKSIEPPYWQANVFETFHSWNKVKYQFIVDVIGKYLGTVENDPSERANVYGYYIQVKTALDTYNNANPNNPLTDENGEPVSLDK